jgi:hypothetical protein
MLSVANEPIMLNVSMLSVTNEPITMNVAMLSVVMLNAVAPLLPFLAFLQQKIRA